MVENLIFMIFLLKKNLLILLIYKREKYFQKERIGMIIIKNAQNYQVVSHQMKEKFIFQMRRINLLLI